MGQADKMLEPQPRQAHFLRLLAALTIVGAVAVLAMWLAGVNPARFWREHQVEVAKEREAAHPPPHNDAVSVVQPTPIGTDSSVSSVPLALHLAGTRVGRNAREGYADIGTDVRTPQTYRGGSLLANGARLEEIYSDRVVLSREGKRATLYVEGTPGAASNAAASKSLAAVLTVGGTHAEADAEADSFDELTDHIRVAPVFEGDKVRALEVYANDKSDTFWKLGLQPGDRITAIDGQEVRDQAASLEALGKLTRGQAMVVIVERGGQPTTLSLDGSLLNKAHAGT